MALVDNILLATLYHLEQLRRRGLVEAPEFLTEEGYADAEALVNHGFTPTKEEIEETMRFIMTKGRLAVGKSDG